MALKEDLEMNLQVDGNVDLKMDSKLDLNFFLNNSKVNLNLELKRISGGGRFLEQMTSQIIRACVYFLNLTFKSCFFNLLVTYFEFSSFF